MFCNILIEMALTVSDVPRHHQEECGYGVQSTIC